MFGLLKSYRNYFVSEFAALGSATFFETIKEKLSCTCKVVVCLMLVVLLANNGWAQTIVTTGGGATITYNAVPSASYTTPPTGVSFSNWTRCIGNACFAVSIGLSVKGFDLNKKFKKD